MGCWMCLFIALTAHNKKESIRKLNYEMNAKWNRDNINLLQSSQSLGPKTVYSVLLFFFFFTFDVVIIIINGDFESRLFYFGFLN